MKFDGRILFLCTDPRRIEAQLAGADLDLIGAGPLRDDVSTDEITPVAACLYYDERLGRYPYTGFKAQDARPIGLDGVRNGGFAVTVAGSRYGKGSSREHSPAAEKAAGIRLIIAKSFERIYRQNADNLGLFTSTDFGLIERIRRGEAIDIEELVASRDAVTAAILRSGGLLRYGRAHLRDAPGRGEIGQRRRPISKRSWLATPSRLQRAIRPSSPEPALSSAPTGVSSTNISPACARRSCTPPSAGP